MLQPGELGGFESVVNVWRQPECASHLQVLVPQVKVVQPVEPDFNDIGPRSGSAPIFANSLHWN